MALNAHTIVADIYMDARNQSADGSSLRLHSSTLNVPKASPSYLMFIERNVGSSLAFKPSDLLDLAPKSEIRPIVKAVFTLPESPFPVPVPNDEISGRLEIVDIHDRKHDIGYSAILARNAPIS